MPPFSSVLKDYDILALYVMGAIYAFESHQLVLSGLLVLSDDYFLTVCCLCSENKLLSHV